MLQLLLALFTNTILVMILGNLWYNQSFAIGQLYVKNYWGSKSIYDVNCKPKQNMQRTTPITIATTILFNILLIVLLKNVYAPKSLNDTLYMALVLVTIHALMELPHLGYEIRSYGAFAIHSVFHYLMAAIPLLVLRFYFNIPNSKTGAV